MIRAMKANIISKIKLINKKNLEAKLSTKFKYKIIIVNFYPEVSNIKKSINTLKNIFKVILGIDKIHCIFTLPSHDVGNNEFENLIKEFIKSNKDYFFYKNLGQTKFLSLLKISTILIGNSSSGIVESATFNIPSINIGDRQKGKLIPKNVINCGFDKYKLLNLIDLYLKKNNLKKVKNPYGDGKSGQRIAQLLNNINLNDDKNLKKGFVSF